MIEKTDRERTVEIALKLVWEEDRDELQRIKDLIRRIKNGENNLEVDKKLLDDYMAGKDVKI